MTATIAQIDFYEALDSETRIVVQQRTTEIKALMRRAASDIIEIGQKLDDVRSRLEDGLFSSWLRSEFDWSRRTAYNFIGVYNRFGRANFAQLNIAASALYLLAAPSTPESVRAEAIGRLEQGETITYSATRDAIEQAQEARRYDGYQNIPAPDEDEDEPLSEYEQGIAERYAHFMGDTPDPEPRISGMSQAMDLLTRQTTVEWYTPPDIIERARALLGGIDLDPASSDTAQQWIQATTYYTEARPAPAAWAGRVWLNPPFDDTSAWVDRLEQAYSSGAVSRAVLLVNSAPGYIWWEDLWRRRPVCMVRERLCFWTPEGKQGGQSKKGTTIAYYGTDIRCFIEAFGELGRIILPEDE